MRKHMKLLDVVLNLFDGAAGGAAAAGGEGAAGGEAAAQDTASALPKAETNRRRGSSRHSRSGEFSNVVYGVQTAAEAGADVASSTSEGNNGVGNTKAEVSTTSDTREAKRQAFKDLIEGEYKNEFTEHFQSTFDRRFKEMKGMEKSLTNQKPIMDLLMQRYQIADGDPAKLMTALEQDNRYYEEAADEAGLTVEQFKAMQKLERENAELKAMKQRQQFEAQRNQQMQAAQQQLNQWIAEGDKLKSIYPSFNFEQEAANKDFLNLLKSGVGVQHAYEVIHLGEVRNETARTAAKSATDQMKANMKRNASRPLENGMSSQSAAIVKNDVSKLSRADRAEIARRVQRGETIKF